MKWKTKIKNIVSKAVGVVNTAHTVVDAFEVKCASKLTGRELDPNISISELESMMYKHHMGQVKEIVRGVVAGFNNDVEWLRK